MKDQSKKIRNQWVGFRVTETEYEQMEKFFRQSTSRIFSQYARNVLLQKPVMIKHRNQSYDDMLSALLLIKKYLGSISNNMNQAVKKLHGFTGDEQIKSWYIMLRLEQKALETELQKLQLFIEKFSRDGSENISA